MKEGWEYKKLGDTLFFDKRFQGLNGCKQEKIVSFSHVSAEELKNLVDENGDVRLLSTGNFSGYTTKEKAGSSLNCGEVITIPTGGTANIKYYNGLFVDSGNIIGIASNASIVLRFIYYAMIANNDTINSYYRGASIKHPYMPDIYKIPIPVPSKFEQQRIVDELDLLSSIIEKKNVQLNELDNLAQSLFYEMFGDPIANEKRWDKNVLNEVAKVTSSKRILQSEWQEAGIPFYKVADIVNLINGECVTPLTFIKETTYNELKSNGLVPKANDVLITSRGTIGQCYIVKEHDSFYFQDGMITWLSNINSLISPTFLVALFANDVFSDSLKHSANSSTVAYISIKQLSNMKIPIPPLTLQQQFASKIEAIEHQKELIKQSIKEVETLFNSRMDYYFN